MTDLKIREQLIEAIMQGLVDDAGDSGTYTCDALDLLESTEDIDISGLQWGADTLSVVLEDGRKFHWRLTPCEL